MWDDPYANAPRLLMWMAWASTPTRWLLERVYRLPFVRPGTTLDYVIGGALFPPGLEVSFPEDATP